MWWGNRGDEAGVSQITKGFEHHAKKLPGWDATGSILSSRG